MNDCTFGNGRVKEDREQFLQPAHGGLVGYHPFLGTIYLISSCCDGFFETVSRCLERIANTFRFVRKALDADMFATI
ncbi:hypothetical protein DF050_04075 [Burkholderia cepacia]|nr:hypothetical protein DF050_04075 [Burkholderia cepacia]